MKKILWRLRTKRVLRYRQTDSHPQICGYVPERPAPNTTHKHTLIPISTLILIPINSYYTYSLQYNQANYTNHDWEYRLKWTSSMNQAGFIKRLKQEFYCQLDYIFESLIFAFSLLNWSHLMVMKLLSTPYKISTVPCGFYFQILHNVFQLKVYWITL